MGDNLLDTQYPSWSRAWETNLPEIDEQIVDFYDGKKEQTAQTLAECCDLVQYWFDNQDLGPQARIEWEQVKAEPDLFETEIQTRVAQLISDGRIRLARTAGQGSSQF